jgi:hypothetical protein
MSTALETAEPQTTNAVLMVRPAGFGPNAETRGTNHFQANDDIPPNAAAPALREFEAMVETLDQHGVAVHVVKGLRDSDLPDEIFPNNWFSTHADGTIVLYPLCAKSRRWERRQDVIARLSSDLGFEVARIVDLSDLEKTGQYLEGTGSLVLDRVNRVAYAGLSARTHEAALAEFASLLEFEIESFATRDSRDREIYHTNVLMSLGDDFAVVCSAAIRPESARRRVLERIAMSGRRIIDIELAQLECFAGNLLELRGKSGPIIVISCAGLASLTTTQREALERSGELVSCDVATIERVGGGSVRCMLAEVHLKNAAICSRTVGRGRCWTTHM